MQLQRQFRYAVCHQIEGAVEQVVIVLAHVQRRVLVKLPLVVHNILQHPHAAAPHPFQSLHKADVRAFPQLLPRFSYLRAFAVMEGVVRHPCPVFVSKYLPQGRHVYVVHVKRRQYVVAPSAYPVKGQTVCGGAVNQGGVAVVHGSEQRGDADRGPNGRKERSAVKHRLFARVQVGGHRTVGNGHVLNHHVGHNLRHGLNDAFALDNVVLGHAEVHKREYFPRVKAVEPFPELGQPAGGVYAPNERPHACACHRGDCVAMRLQRLYRPYVSKSSRPAAAQHQRHILFLVCHLW